MGKYRRFELEFCGGISEELLNNLIANFDQNLTIPNFEDFDYDKGRFYPASYFTDKGYDRFETTINSIIKEVERLDNGWEIVEEAVNSEGLLYKDEMQVVILKEY